MQILAITSQKGGVGKTTLSMNIAVAAALDGWPTLVLDLDPQASATDYYDKRLAARGSDQPQVLSIQASRLAPALQAAIEDGYKLVVVDTPPNVGHVMAEIVKVGDMVLIPMKPSPVDLSAVEATIKVVKFTDRPHAVVLNEVRAAGTVADEVEAAIIENYECPVLKQRIGNRVAFEHAAISGMGVVETEPSSKAADEVRALWKVLKSSLKQIRQVDADAAARKEVVNG